MTNLLPLPITATSTVNATQPQAGNIVTRLRTLLGQGAVLLHVAVGKKAPTLAGWPQTTVADMERGD